jgi:hypothetical protein
MMEQGARYKCLGVPLRHRHDWVGNRAWHAGKGVGGVEAPDKESESASNKEVELASGDEAEPEGAELAIVVASAHFCIQCYTHQ